ncbi:MAG TPA: site-specific DNA-methyltransferase [Noviherbaspirillum sp.]|jgi:DNA modification methylase|uniref:DNA-methyltransferase n=1 Tax=Noviherbaspirillum sp. TaxID=1926288 RepID=UPI002F94E885
MTVTVRILIGDVREQLRTLPADFVHCVVTSPPYWGLRDYGVAGQIGLEASPSEFIATMVEVFDEVRRVLRPDGTCWVNMGDSYAGNRGSTNSPAIGLKHRSASGDAQRQMITSRRRDDAPIPRSDVRVPGLKPKDLVMMPHRLAIALQDAGWWVRQDIVWHKPNPMPESVRDRCTKAHEYIFLLTKSESYYYDQDAISEPVSPNTHARLAQDVQNQKGSARANGGTKTNGTMKAVGRKLADAGSGIKSNSSFDAALAMPVDRRNKRSVWTITTQPFSEAHFATFPPELPEMCIKAGCPPGGLVLDPFFGAGTTGLVADRLQRDCIGIELNPAYAEIARRRIQGEASLLADVTLETKEAA